MTKSGAELGGWRDALHNAVDPERTAQTRDAFQLVFRRRISVFARPEHPLAPFLDDLQWLDGATLDLLEGLLTQPDAHHLM